MKRLIILFFGMIVSLYGSIGEITAINGDAHILRGSLAVPIKEHTEIEEKDIIKTMKNTKLQIVFEDNTVISLGQKTTFEIEEYLFSQTKPKAKFHISKGLFKSITGKIGHIAPKNFKLRTQNATIGVRGTTIIGETSKDVDTIVCSSGKIVVSSPLGTVSVNKGEQTTVKKNSKPTPAVKVSVQKILQIDKTIKPTTRKDVEKVAVPEVAEQKERVDQISGAKEDWGDWGKEKIITQELEKKPQPIKEQPEEEEEEQEQVTEDDQPKPALASLQALRDCAGSSNPTYSGTVSGFVDNPTNKISDIDNHINLDFDLGQGTLKGDMGFKTDDKTWQADITNGTVDKRGQFDFDLQNKSDNLNGSGDGMLSGEKLQNADGTFNLDNQNQKVFGTFCAKKN